MVLEDKATPGIAESLSPLWVCHQRPKVGEKALEVCVEEPGLLDPAALADALDAHGIGAIVVGFCTPERDLSSEDKSVRRAALDYLMNIGMDLNASWELDFWGLFRRNLEAADASLDQAVSNSQIAEELNLPPVKIHCSVLAEDAIKAAIADYKAKRNGAAKAQ